MGDYREDKQKTPMYSEQTNDIIVTINHTET